MNTIETRTQEQSCQAGLGICKRWVEYTSRGNDKKTKRYRHRLVG